MSREAGGVRLRAPSFQEERPLTLIPYQEAIRSGDRGQQQRKVEELLDVVGRFSE